MKQFLFVILLYLFSTAVFAQTELGLAKQNSAAAVNNLDGSFTTTVTYTLHHYGLLPISNVQIRDVLTSQFSPGTIRRSASRLVKKATSSEEYSDDKH